jgi:hypothetical protein
MDKDINDIRVHGPHNRVGIDNDITRAEGGSQRNQICGRTAPCGAAPCRATVDSGPGFNKGVLSNIYRLFL